MLLAHDVLPAGLRPGITAGGDHSTRDVATTWAAVLKNQVGQTYTGKRFDSLGGDFSWADGEYPRSCVFINCRFVGTWTIVKGYGNRFYDCEFDTKTRSDSSDPARPNVFQRCRGTALSNSGVNIPFQPHQNTIAMECEWGPCNVGPDGEGFFHYDPVKTEGVMLRSFLWRNLIRCENLYPAPNNGGTAGYGHTENEASDARIERSFFDRADSVNGAIRVVGYRRANGGAWVAIGNRFDDLADPNAARMKHVAAGFPYQDSPSCWLDNRLTDSSLTYGTIVTAP